MRRSYRLQQNHGYSTIGCVAIALIVVVVAALVGSTLLVQAQANCRRRACLDNLEGLSAALGMYTADYDDVLPSSVLHQAKPDGRWDPVVSAEFCLEQGPVPPPEKLRPADTRWVQIVWPYMKDRRIWCSLDPQRPSGPSYGAPRAPASYVYRPAVDRAWSELGVKGRPARTMAYYRDTNDRIAFFERDCWHDWNRGHKGWRNGSMVNAAFFSGFVKPVRLTDAAGCDVPRTAAEFARAMKLPGEPMWYNRNNATKKTGRGVWFDPRSCYDDLQR